MKTQTAAIRLLQVAYDDAFGELVEINGLVAARAEANYFTPTRRARQRDDLGADLRGNGAEYREPGL